MKSHFHSKSVAALAALVLVGLSPASVQAKEPMIQVGGGIEGSTADGTINVLLRAGFGIHGKASTGEEYVWVHIKGDMAYTQGGAEHQTPYLDAQFSLYQRVFGTLDDQTGVIRGWSPTALPVRLRRDVRLDEATNFNISAVGIDVGGVKMSSAALGVYAQFALDALGWKALSHVSDTQGFSGFRWGGLGAEVGLLTELSDGFKLRVAVGGQFDYTTSTRVLSVAVGPVSAGQESTLSYSNATAYLEARLDIANLIQLFTRGSINAVITQEGDADRVIQSYMQIMGGVTVMFN